MGSIATVDRVATHCKRRTRLLTRCDEEFWLEVITAVTGGTAIMKISSVPVLRMDADAPTGDPDHMKTELHPLE
jgi:hypothetical protein